MARGRKSYTLEEQLEKVTSEIDSMDASMKELKKTKKNLEEQIKMNRLAELDNLISESGKSFDEIKQLLNA